MNSRLVVPLQASAEQAARLRALQLAFAQVCNALSPLMQQQRCWNRVTLHHLAYRSLRQKFPSIGSQMICNAIYSVSRTGRMIFQHPASPFNIARLGSAPLPMITFLDHGPVYFDRHTLSVKAGELSLYTLDGRTRFKVGLDPAQEAGFRARKLLEVVLSRRIDQVFELAFIFADGNAEQAAELAPHVASRNGHIPEYVQIEAAA